MIYGSVCSGIEAATVAWHPFGWKPAFFSEIEKFPRAVLEYHYSNVPIHGDFTTIQKDDYEPIDLLVGGTPCQSFSVAGLRGGLDDERGNLALEFLRLADRLHQPAGCFGKMSPASCRRMEDGTLVPFSGRWANSGMGSPTDALTLNISDWPSDVSVCLLSDILEIGDLPQRFYLSPKACAGILRRAEKRGRQLPPLLQMALEHAAQMTTKAKQDT